MSDERTALVQQSWRNIIAWCRENAPVTADTLRGPASEEALAAAQAEMGYEWPAELLAWLRVGDGALRTLQGDLIPPGFIPMGVDQIMGDWRLMIEVIGDIVQPEEVKSSEGAPAGTYSAAWCRSFIPIGDYTTGDLLFIDLRSGPQSGCIREWEDGAAHLRKPNWDSIASMLADIDQALRAGQWGDDETGRIPTVENGALRWKYSEGWETIDG
ncbi:MAG: SMI1/KNR4 family protein [Actinobacteria bacterium]|nr:SMI1/KNR4 family protein [Actinomycetota bacterium]